MRAGANEVPSFFADQCLASGHAGTRLVAWLSGKASIYAELVWLHMPHVN
jgi:hypothetical protein